MTQSNGHVIRPNQNILDSASDVTFFLGADAYEFKEIELYWHRIKAQELNVICFPKKSYMGFIGVVFLSRGTRSQ